MYASCLSTSFTRKALSLVSVRSTVLMPNSAAAPSVISPVPGITTFSPAQRYRHGLSPASSDVVEQCAIRGQAKGVRLQSGPRVPSVSW